MCVPNFGHMALGMLEPNMACQDGQTLCFLDIIRLYLYKVAFGMAIAAARQIFRKVIANSGAQRSRETGNVTDGSSVLCVALDGTASRYGSADFLQTHNES